VNKIYFDHSATTPVIPEVADEVRKIMTDCYGNASTLYQTGQIAHQYLESARKKVANIFAADPKEIFFTSGGSESDNLAIKGVAEAYKNKGSHIIVFAIEHPAVLETCKYLEKHGYQVTYIPPETNGIVDPEKIKAAITNQTILISVMMANNVIGTIQPIKEIATIARERGVIFHTDAVQAAGTLPINVQELGVDLLSISAHKFHGPKGVGALYVRKGTKIAPQIHGGGHERGKRSGTENVPGIVGLAKALEITNSEINEKANRLAKLRNKLVDGILAEVPEVKFLGDREKRLPGNACFSFKYIEGESLVLHLDMAGIAAASGSACASHSLEPSHVLLGIGLPAVEAHGSLRITLGRENTETEVVRFLEVVPGIVKRLRKMSPFSQESEKEYFAGGPRSQSKLLHRTDA
jgi:cysteine desulfurase